jgi:coenzyme F420-reducing hydrogenase gamma subunit
VKPKVAFFSFTSCEGCQLALLECENELLDILGAVDVVKFREAMSETSDEYDIAFIEGSISTPHDEEKIKKIRDTAKVIIEFGACAATGGLNAMRNSMGTEEDHYEELREKVYGPVGVEHFRSTKARPVHAVVPVELTIPGCPVDRGHLLEVIEAVLVGRTPRQFDHPLCVECKLNDTVCVVEAYGQMCMGPVTRAGCDSICPNVGDACEGCRGLLPSGNFAAHQQMLEEHGNSKEEIRLRYLMFNAYPCEELEVPLP